MPTFCGKSGCLGLALRSGYCEAHTEHGGYTDQQHPSPGHRPELTEIAALEIVLRALEKLEPEARQRVVEYAARWVAENKKEKPL